MGVASLVLGIISVIFAWIPFCGYIALVPAIVGLILGIVNVVKQSKIEGGKKGLGIAGVVLNIIALVFIIFYTIVFTKGASDVLDAARNIDWDEVQREIESSY